MKEWHEEEEQALQEKDQGTVSEEGPIIGY